MSRQQAGIRKKRRAAESRGKRRQGHGRRIKKSNKHNLQGLVAWHAPLNSNGRTRDFNDHVYERCHWGCQVGQTRPGRHKLNELHAILPGPTYRQLRRFAVSKIENSLLSSRLVIGTLPNDVIDEQG